MNMAISVIKDTVTEEKDVIAPAFSLPLSSPEVEFDDPSALIRSAPRSAKR